MRQRAPREAEAKVFEARVARRKQINEELEAARLKFEEEQRIEQARKDDLIRQIRALERVPKQRVKLFDPTESSGVGLLEEMSLVELKERLELNKARYEEEEQERRRNILRRKREKEVDLRNRVKNISRIRSALVDDVACARNAMAWNAACFVVLFCFVVFVVFVVWCVVCGVMLLPVLSCVGRCRHGRVCEP